MQRDIAARREPELDAIAGAVLRAGIRHAIECPTVARLSEMIARRAGAAPPRVGS
jgi:ketopantoate reductase